MAGQLAFDFSRSPGAAPGEGIEAWRAERRKHIESLARKQGLPLGGGVPPEISIFYPQAETRTAAVFLCLSDKP